MKKRKTIVGVILTLLAFMLVPIQTLALPVPTWTAPGCATGVHEPGTQYDDYVCGAYCKGYRFEIPCTGEFEFDENGDATLFKCGANCPAPPDPPPEPLPPPPPGGGRPPLPPDQDPPPSLPPQGPQCTDCVATNSCSSKTNYCFGCCRACNCSVNYCNAYCPPPSP